MEDEWTDAETLYQLWIAEGIVLSSDKRKGETIIQVAKSYMGELVHRSMVQAKGEDFFEAIDIGEGNDLNLNRYDVSRVAKTRQLLLRVLSLENIRHPQRSVSGAFFGTNIGRVLGSLVYLRYLSLRGSNLITFPWIHNLVLLQTLNLNVPDDNFKSPVSSNDLGKLSFLRHLYLPPWVSLQLLKNTKLRFNGLSKLETLENFNTEWCEIKNLPKLSGLRRLTLKAEGGYDDVKEMLKYLSDLALSSNSSVLYLSLVIRISGDPGWRNDPDMIRQLFWNHKFSLQELEMHGKLPELCEIFEQQQQLNHNHIDVSLIRITKLTLRKSCLEEDPMRVLKKIPTLRDLKLFYGAYKGKEMVCSAMGFPRLTRLHLGNLDNFESWRVEKGSMPLLQDLFIHTCLKLEELPEELIFLNCLRELILWKMPSGLYDRVLLENGEQGPEFYKVAHIPNLVIVDREG
ncbi:putative disease resistance protein RXW24L [Apium graveolens]|uniref:putative disease resistance protein RXW24L n=1 Tax=Apium graveolens TaxID=4045 RepID=UPI003D7B93E3